MKFKFRVYYKDGTEGPWEMSEKFKLISAKDKKEAVQKFMEKYPNYVPVYVS